jgi:hypothetical protein
MRIGIIGAGNMGATLGRIWATKGHEVFFSFSKNPSKLKELASSVSGARSGSPSEAAQFGEVVMLATQWGTTQDAVKAAGDLKGKILIECTNPLTPDFSSLAVGGNTSGSEEIAKRAKGAKVVKAFNTLGAQNLTNLRYGALNADTFVCGDDAEAKAIAVQLGKDLGFDVVDCGPLSSARYIEGLGMLWIKLAYALGQGPNIAFKLLKR